MGNNTNAENWAAQERLRAIERAIWWRGWLKRKDIVEIFGVSMAQASSDLQKYLEINANAMVYHMSHKRYERSADMKCVLQSPDFDDAVRCFLSASHLGQVSYTSEADASNAHSQVAIVSLPSRKANLEAERSVMQALLNDGHLRMKYWSVSSGKAEWREIKPIGLGHDGYRWHARAWCCNHNDFRDFVLSRISGVKASHTTQEIPVDEDWQTIDTVSFRPNSKLQENSRRAIELDYGIAKNGSLQIKVRRAMRDYLLKHMRVSSLGLENHFELEE